jgi:hypothetical protein
VWMLCRVLVERKKPGMRPAASASRHRRARAATRWLPAGYCGKLLLATAASWLIQQNLTGSVSVYQEV